MILLRAKGSDVVPHGKLLILGGGHSSAGTLTNALEIQAVVRALLQRGREIDGRFGLRRSAQPWRQPPPPPPLVLSGPRSYSRLWFAPEPQCS